MSAPVFPSSSGTDELLAKAQAFVDRKYVARADVRQKEMGLAYVEAERQDLAREIVRFVEPYIANAGSMVLRMGEAVDTMRAERDALRGVAQGWPDRGETDEQFLESVEKALPRYVSSRSRMLAGAALADIDGEQSGDKTYYLARWFQAALPSPPAALPAGEDLRKQSYEVARHVIGYLEGNCGLSFIDVKQADWDAVTRLVATLALSSTDREGGK